jgi:4-amino-4-deoxy-L-arabinose transferase-like glycosyltransferase
MNRRPVVVILVASVLIRVLGAFYLGNSIEPMPGTYDQISYHMLALRVLDGHGFTFDRYWWPSTPAGAETAMWSYLYVYFLVAVYWLFGPYPLVARLIQAAVVGVLHPSLAYLLGCRVGNKWVGLIAALLTAGYAYFVYYAGALMTEPFYITAILFALYMMIRLGDAEGQHKTALAVGLGLTIGIAVLLRQLFLLTVPAIILWWWELTIYGTVAYL